MSRYRYYVATLALSVCGTAFGFFGTADDYAVMLTSENPQDVKDAAENMHRRFNGNRRVNDIAAKRLLVAIDGTAPLDEDTAAWLAKAVGGSGSLRYRDLLLDVQQRGPLKARSWAKLGLRRMSVPAETFDGNAIDLEEIRRQLDEDAPRMNASLQELLHSGNSRMVHQTAERMYYVSRILNDDSFATAAELVQRHVASSDREMEQALIWLCRTLARSGNKDYLAALSVAAAEGSAKLRKHAKLASEQLHRAH